MRKIALALVLSLATCLPAFAQQQQAPKANSGYYKVLFGSIAAGTGLILVAAGNHEDEFTGDRKRGYTVAGLGLHHLHADGDGGNPLHASLGAVLVFLSWLGGVGFVLRRVLEWPVFVALPIAAVAGVGVAALLQRAIRKLSDPTGSASPRLASSTPAISVVVTAPRPTQRMPSLPSAGATVPLSCASSTVV